MQQRATVQLSAPLSSISVRPVSFSRSLRALSPAGRFALPILRQYEGGRPY
jgi:hypothetical protein